MRKDLYKPIHSSFLSCEKDVELILKKLFAENPSYSELLKRLLVINTSDCIDNTESKVYKDVLEKCNLKYLIDNGYVRLDTKIENPEHEEIKSYMIITFDDFTPNDTNPEFRDCTISFDVICHTDYNYLGNFRQRVMKIIGYIDGLLNNTKLTGIGILNFLGCKKMYLGEELSGYSLMYRAVHGSDDIIPSAEEE